jgi:hypothetical protein
VEGQLVTIEVLSSKLSGRRRVYRDGTQIVDRQQFDTTFSHMFESHGHSFMVVQHGEHFDLRIDNISFSHLNTQMRTKSAFQFDDSDAQDQV